MFTGGVVSWGGAPEKTRFVKIMASPSSSSSYTCTLTEEVLKKAKEELSEDPNTRLLEIKTLRERLQKVPGLKCRTEDEFLLRFLRCKKFDQERAFAQVVTFYKMRKDNPDVYENLTPQRVRGLLEAGVTCPLKDRAPDGSRVIYFRPGKWDPDKYTLADVLANNYLTLSKLIEEEETQVCGFTMLADLQELGWNQGKNLSPFYAKKITSLIQEAFPARFKGIHYVNEPTFFDVIFTIVKQFMKEKMQKRIRLYGDIHGNSENMKKLHAFFPPSILPTELGGSLPSVNPTEWAEKMLACEAQFAEDNKYGMLDMTIPAKAEKKMDATEALGGTFRKLNVD